MTIVLRFCAAVSASVAPVAVTVAAVASKVVLANKALTPDKRPFCWVNNKSAAACLPVATEAKFWASAAAMVAAASCCVNAVILRDKASCSFLSNICCSWANSVSPKLSRLAIVSCLHAVVAIIACF